MIKTEIKPNQAQQTCIDNIEGKYLVLAGPGTGKTFTLIQRIASMIQKGIEPNKILCLTFSDAAANEMKTRLSHQLNKLDTRVNIYTYHSFCNEIILDNLEDFSLSQNSKIITQSISRQLIKECIDELNPVEYRSSKNDPYVFLETILSQIEEIKKNRLKKEEYFKNIEQNPDWKPNIKALEDKLEDYKLKNKKIPAYLPNSIEAAQKKVNKAYEIWEFYELYKNKMEANHFLDYNDMINFVLERFEAEPAFLNEIANKYDYILVDEYQDTNKNQNDIIFNLVKSLKSQNVFVVGDDDQIIYTFQGAQLDTIEKFLDNFPDTKVICLKENLRSTPSILQVARAIAMQDPRRLEINPKFLNYNISKELIAKNENLIDSKVTLSQYFDVNQEYYYIANEIEELINKGYSDLSQIAVLFKNNSEISTFSKFLKDRNIPFELKEGKNIFEIKSTIVLYYYLKALNNPELNSDCLLKLLLLEPFNFNSSDYTKILLKRSNNKSFLDSIKEINDFIEPDKIKAFFKTFNYLKEFKNNESLRDIVIETAAKTGILDYYLNSKINRQENISALKKIFNEAEAFSNNYQKITLAEFLEYLDLSIADNIPIKTDKAPVALNAIQLSTYHSSKGREFEIVYMPTLLKNYWESDNSSLKARVPLDKNEYKTEEELKELKRSDKIKLMYVGLTRAKSVLKLSYVQNINLKAKSPSEFIADIQHLTDIKEYSNYDLDSYYLELKNSIVKRNYDYKRDFKNYIDGLINDRSFSASAINTYLNCPRQYLYNNILDLQSKYAYCDALHFGSAVHKALEEGIKFTKANSNYPKSEFLIETFKKELNKMPLSSIEQRQILLKRGEIAINNYYSQFITTPINSIDSSEFLLNEKDGDYKFVGIIDRIDKNPDGSYSIYDYKTGSAKPINKVAPNEAYENYYNQIGLYKYFFEKKTNKKVKETVLIFPEEPTKNLSLNLNEEDIEEILKKFKNAIDEIKKHNFEPSLDKKACEYCAYKDFCALEVL